MSTRKRKAKLKGIGPPHGKQRQILEHLLKPDPDNVKFVDVCCGRGFGKTLLAIVVTVYMLSLNSRQCGLFLEPDSKRVDSVFRFTWKKVVPKWLWTETKSENKITWFNGSVIYYDHRDISGNIEARRDRNRGPNYTFVISDEEAIKCDRQQYTNTLAAIREPSPVRFFLTISTPKVGEYKALITSPGHKVFTGTSHDNVYLPAGFVDQLIATMSRDQVRREIFAEFVALEGRIWREFDSEKAWPDGNIHNGLASYDKTRPYWLFCDMGSATGAYVVVQSVPALKYGERLFEGNVWVAVADLCPYNDASAIRAFSKIDTEFGPPLAVVGGADINTRSNTDGKSIAYFARQVWPGVHIKPCDEHDIDKQIQFDRLSYLICSAQNERRFCIAKDFVELEPEGRRGLKQTMEEDVWDEKHKSKEFLPKGSSCMVQHTRDAVMMGAAKIMSPPRWGHNSDRTK